ncbi:MAG: nucleotidyltransferase domain-containing protein [Cryomorphaceae bacterium]|nr:MAG: nucleotidyltransferase domain-containing protein [Cryomorphaceae bacterium]
MFGLKDSDIEAMNHVLRAFPGIEEAVIFGSRAMGNYRRGSDVDIALFGEGVDVDTAQKVAWQLNEETLMPYRFDVLSYANISNPDLRDHIRRVGLTLYSTNPHRIAGEPVEEYLKSK